MPWWPNTVYMLHTYVVRCIFRYITYYLFTNLPTYTGFHSQLCEQVLLTAPYLLGNFHIMHTFCTWQHEEKSFCFGIIFEVHLGDKKPLPFSIHIEHVWRTTLCIATFRYALLEFIKCVPYSELWPEKGKGHVIHEKEIWHDVRLYKILNAF